MAILSAGMGKIGQRQPATDYAMRMPVAFASLLVLGTAACEDPSAPPRHSYVCQAQEDQTVEAATLIETANARDVQLDQDIRNAIQHNGFTLQANYEGVEFVTRADGSLIEVNVTGAAVDVGAGVELYPYKQYLAYNPDTIVDGRTGEGRISYGLYAAPYEPYTMARRHSATGGFNEQQVILESAQLSEEMLPYVPAVLRQLGDTTINITGGGTTTLGAIHSEAARDIRSNRRRAEALTASVDRVYAEFPLDKARCDAEDEAISEHMRRFGPVGAAPIPPVTAGPRSPT